MIAPSPALSTSEVLGITFGVIFGLVAIVLCVIFTCACYVSLKRRKKVWRISQVWRTHVYGVVILSPQRVTLKFERLYTLIPNKEGSWVLGLQGSVASILYSGVGMYFKVGQPMQPPTTWFLILCQTNTCCHWSVQNLFNINFSGKKVWRPWAFQPPLPTPMMYTSIVTHLYSTQLTTTTCWALSVSADRHDLRTS